MSGFDDPRPLMRGAVRSDRPRIEADWWCYGLWCVVTRVPPFGHLCGYVRVNQNHDAYYLSAEQLEEQTDVHGGVTYVGDLTHVDESQTCPPYRFVGFDCLHGGDAVDPQHYTATERFSSLEQGHVWTIDEAIAECERLAAQLLADPRAVHDE